MRNIESEILSFRNYIGSYTPDIPGLEFMNQQNCNEVLCIWRKNVIKSISILYNSYLYGKITEEDFFADFDSIKSQCESDKKNET